PRHVARLARARARAVTADAIHAEEPVLTVLGPAAGSSLRAIGYAGTEVAVRGLDAVHIRAAGRRTLRRGLIGAAGAVDGIVEPAVTRTHARVARGVVGDPVDRLALEVDAGRLAAGALAGHRVVA